MGFSEVSGLDADVTVALGKKDKSGKPYPTKAEGYFLGTRSVESKRGDSKLHFLQTSKGNLGVWGTTDLNRKLGSVAPGTMVRITSTGTKPTPNGDMYTYKVEQDKGNTIEVAGGESVSSGSDYSDDTYSSHISNEDAEDYAQAEELAALERKRQVEEMLAKKSVRKN
jgi:hypothetical protein